MCILDCLLVSATIFYTNKAKIWMGVVTSLHMHKFYFTNRVVDQWNSLPNWVVTANNTKIFKKTNWSILATSGYYIWFSSTNRRNRKSQWGFESKYCLIYNVFCITYPRSWQYSLYVYVHRPIILTSTIIIAADLRSTTKMVKIDGITVDRHV